MRNLKLGTRVFMLVAIFIAGFVLYGVLSYRTLEQLRVNGPIYDRVVQGKDAIADVLPPPKYLVETYLITLQLTEETNPIEIDALIKKAADLRREYDDRQAYWLQKREEGPLKKALTDRSHQPAMAFRKVFVEQFLPLVKAGDRAKAKELARGPLKTLYEEHRAGVDEVVALAAAENKELEVQAEHTVRSDTRNQIILACVIVGLFVIVSFTAAKTASGLVARIEMASSAAKKVASGDLTTALPHGGEDETGRLLGAIKTMTENLNSLVNRVKQASIDIMSTATEISATNRQQQEMVTSFGTSTTEIAAATTEIFATSQELLSTMESVSQVASRTSSLAEGGRTGIAGMDGMMRQLASSTTSISSKLSAIQEKAGAINLAVTTITKVADQTNLLSVNAAIEAEKAGEYGLGFLVLAREIRRLADQTAVATLDIERMVRQMQAAVSAGVMEMDKFTEEVRRGVTTSAQIASQLGEIIEQVQTLTERFDVVNEGMRNQSLGAKQINEAMGQLTEGARQTTQSIKEFASSTDHLRSAVGLLKEEVSRFNVTST